MTSIRELLPQQQLLPLHLIYNTHIQDDIPATGEPGFTGPVPVSALHQSTEFNTYLPSQAIAPCYKVPQNQEDEHSDR